MGKPEGERPLGRPRRKWVDNINMQLGEIGYGGVGWIGLAHDRDKRRALVNAVMNGLHKMLGNYLMASQLAVSQVVLSSIELVSQLTHYVNQWRCR
jgi:hypothetical protein